MQSLQKTASLRIFAEAVAIVASILLAFAIDAWWQRRSELELADDLVVSLHADFQASQTHLEQWLSGYRRVFRALMEFRNRLRETETNDALRVSEDLVLAAVSAPTYSPTDATLLSAISSGQIEFIRDPGLRNHLARWSQELDDTREDEELIRQIVVHQLVPALSDEVRLGYAFENHRVVGWFLGNLETDPGDTLPMSHTSRLEGAVAEKAFYTAFVVDGLEDLQETQAQILRLLESRMHDD